MASEVIEAKMNKVLPLQPPRSLRPHFIIKIEICIKVDLHGLRGH